MKPVCCVGMAFYVSFFLEVWDDKAGVGIFVAFVFGLFVICDLCGFGG